MIKTVNIKVSAGDPQAPIGPFYVFKASAASLTIVDVPKSLGARTITGVTVRAKNADGVEVGIAAVRNGSAWGGTIPASHFDREGTVSNGIVIQATGKSDDGTTAVTWIIGSGQLIILNDAGEITAGDTRYEVDWYMTQPTNPKRGAMCKINGVIKIYTNNSWQPIGGDDAAVHKADFAAVEQLPETFTENEMRTKLNTVISILKGTSAALLAALWILPASAGLEVQTAAKGDIKNTEQIVTNVTFSGESGLTTNDVREISSTQITNSVLAGYLCTSNAAAAMARGAYVAATNDASAKYIPFYEECNDNYKISKGIFCPYTYCDAVYVSDVYNLIYDGPTGHQSFKSYIDSATNALATVAHSGSYTDLSNKPTAADIGAYEASKGEADHTTVSNLLAYVGGQNVRVSVTNYYGATSGDLPRLRIEEYQTVTNSGSEISAWNTVWDEDDKFDLFRTNILSGVAVMTNGTITALTSITNAIVQYADQTKAPKAWGMYASDGTLAPSDTVVHATSKTMFGGNTEFKCFAIGTDQVGFLVRKGTTAYSATEPGEFKFYNMSGNHFFGMHIRDEVELGCDTDGITITDVGGDKMVTLTYNVTMTGKPSIHYAATLDATPIVWEKLSKRDGTQVPGASKAVTWEAVTTPGTEVCHINMGAAPKGFYYATIDDPAESWLHTDLVLNAQGGILCTNEYTGLTANIEPYIDDASNTVKWRVKP